MGESKFSYITREGGSRRGSSNRHPQIREEEVLSTRKSPPTRYGVWMCLSYSVYTGVLQAYMGMCGDEDGR